MPIVIETAGEWVERHGGLDSHVVIDNGRRWLFKDGASCDANKAIENRQEPPEESLERLKLKLRYWRTIQQMAQNSFRLLKGLTLGWQPVVGGSFTWNHIYTHYGKPQTMDALKDLETLVEVRAKAKRQADKIAAKIEQSPTVQLARTREELRRQEEEGERRRQEAQRAKIESIVLDDSDEVTAPSHGNPLTGNVGPVRAESQEQFKLGD